MMSIADFFAAGSLFVAVVALVKSFLSDRKVKKLDLALKEKELRDHDFQEVEKHKADVEVEVIETLGNKLNKLRFYNRGKSDAINVSFEILSDKGKDDIALRMQNGYLPYPKLLSYQCFEVGYFNCSNLPHQTIRIIWDDEYAKCRSKEMIIDM